MRFKEPVIIFIVALFFAMHITGLIHVWYLERNFVDIYNEAISFPYFINFILATLITAIIYNLRKKYTSSLGFLFMAGSLLKFSVFFLLFKPLYIADGEMTGVEFAYFFVPYAVCLIAETVFLVRVLNVSDNN